MFLFNFNSGQTDYNIRGIAQGSVDTKLNETGIKQARILASVLPVHEYDLIYSSDLARAYDTAREIILPIANGQTERLIRSDARLQERSLGPLDGKHVSLFLEACRLAGKEPDEFAPEGGELPEKVRLRLLDFLENRLLKGWSMFRCCTVVL